jgi:hypothetical protein
MNNKILDFDMTVCDIARNGIKPVVFHRFLGRHNVKAYKLRQAA